jgi:beta-N-acetylhexosaminidase
MLPARSGLDVREYALSAEALDDEVNEAIAFAQGAQQIVLQTYNAMFVEGQRRLVEALPHDRLAGGGPPAV